MFRSRSTAASQQYIPPHIQQEIGRHLESKVPEHLQQIGGSRIPARSQKAISREMDNMPAHLKQYAGAYMEQNILGAKASSAAPDQSSAQPHAQASDTTKPPQLTETGLFAADRPLDEPQPEAQTPGTPSNSDAYDFIMKTTSQPKGFFKLMSGPSMTKNLLIIAGIGVVLVLFIVIMSSLVFKSTGLTTILTPVGKQQSNLLALTQTQGSNSVAQSTKNLTVDLTNVIGSDEYQLKNFAKSHNAKLSVKLLAGSVSAANTQALQNAKSASNFDSVYIGIAQTDLNSYIATLRTSFSNTPKTSNFTKTRQLLNDDFSHAVTLLDEAKTAASSLGN